MSNSYLRYMRNIFKNIKVAKSEPRKTEEKRSSMAKVPDFIANLRERTTEEKRGSMTQVPDFIKNLRERSTEEKRGSLTQVPNYIQQIRERSTMKPSEMQAISEEVKGAKRKTLSGHERQRQLQEQVQKKEETNKCCEDIVDHLLEHLVSGLANNVIEESERDEEIAHYLSEMYILRTIRDTCQNSIDDCYDVQAIPAVIDELLDDLVVKDFVQPISTYILHNTRAIHQISSELVFKILVDDIICPQVLEAQELALKSKAVSDVILRLKQKNFIRRLQRAATLSKINSFSSTITHVWKGAFIRGLQLTAQRSLRVESLTGRLASTLNFSIFRHIRAIFKTIQEYDPHGPTTEDIRYQQIMNSIAHWQAHKTRADILGLIRKLPAARKAQKEAREQELLEALYSIFERKIVRREVAQLAAAEIKKEKIISEIQVAVDTDNLTQGLPEGTFESPRSSPAKTYFYGSPDYPSFEDEELRDSPPNKLQGSSYYGLAPVPKNPQSSLPIAQVKNYYIENPAAIGAEEKDIDAVCIHCYENIKLIDMDFHSQICTGEVAQPPDENLEVDQRVVKLLNSVSERSLLCGMDVFKFFNSITQIGESIICMSGDMSTLQNELQIISDAASEYADGFSVVVYCKRLSYLASLKGQQNQVAQLTAENLLLHYEAEAAKQRAELEKWKSYSEALLNLANEAHEPIEEIDSDVGSMQERFSANSAFSIMSESDTYSEIEFSARYMGEEEKKKLFFGFCLKFKLRIPRTHPGNALSMNEVYKEAMTEKIEIDRWEEFIENKLSNA